MVNTAVDSLPLLMSVISLPLLRLLQCMASSIVLVEAADMVDTTLTLVNPTTKPTRTRKRHTPSNLLVIVAR
jgi:hypothetical protein